MMNNGSYVKSAAMLLLATLCCPLPASSADELIRAETFVNGGENKTTFVKQKKLIDSSTQSTIVNLDGIEHAVVFPEAAAGVSIEHVEIIDGTGTTRGTPFIWRAYTAGELRVRAKVRYGWFDEFESHDENLPTLEIFVDPEFALKLPRFEANTAGYVDVFTATNERQVLESLFSTKTLRLIRTKKVLFAEQDSELILDAINFSNDCGIRYQARVKSAVLRGHVAVASKASERKRHC